MDKSALVLFGKTRRAILTQVLLNPRGFRLRELARLTGISSGAIQQDLNRLLDGGILERIKEHGQITYHANTHSRIHTELRSIVQKTMGEAIAIREALDPFGDKIDAAFIYGSTASHEAGPASDIDLFVISELAYIDLVKALQRVEEQAGKPLNMTLLTREQFEEKRNGGDRFLTGILAKPMLAVKGELPS